MFHSVFHKYLLLKINKSTIYLRNQTSIIFQLKNKCRDLNDDILSDGKKARATVGSANVVDGTNDDSTSDEVEQFDDSGANVYTGVRPRWQLLPRTNRLERVIARTIARSEVPMPPRSWWRSMPAW